MLPTKKVVSLSLALFSFTFLNAQIEVAHLAFKGFSATGFGGFLNVAVPVTEGNSITAEAGFYSFKKDDDLTVIVPFLLGYRYTLNGSGTGLYIEPTAGYTIGGSDIQKTNQFNSPIVVDGKFAEQKVVGVTSGIGTGYIFPGSLAFNIGMRYQHVFVSKDPALNLFSLRISHSFSFGRRDD